jgi:hypothetical protein
MDGERVLRKCIESKQAVVKERLKGRKEEYNER